MRATWHYYEYDSDFFYMHYLKETIVNEMYDVVPMTNEQKESYSLLYVLRESVKNVLDAITTYNLTSDSKKSYSVILKVEQSTDQLVLKIKDVGCGFPHLERGVQEKRVEDKLNFTPDEKSDGSHLGGMRLGLNNMCKHILLKNGEMFIKNRKHGGATVTIKYPTPLSVF